MSLRRRLRIEMQQGCLVGGNHVVFVFTKKLHLYINESEKKHVCHFMNNHVLRKNFQCQFWDACDWKCNNDEVLERLMLFSFAQKKRKFTQMRQKQKQLRHYNNSHGVWKIFHCSCGDVCVWNYNSNAICWIVMLFALAH